MLPPPDDLSDRDEMIEPDPFDADDDASGAGAPELPDLDDVLDELLDRQPEQDMVPSLDRVAAVMDLLGDPQRAAAVVHVTGTNGKSSCARMIDALLRGAGLRTGLFTSPHLRSITERICVDGEPISDEVFVAAYEEVRPIIDIVDSEQAAEGRPGLTFFEVLTCMAFAVFADAPVDVAVIEVGIGGRWDATNVADGAVNVITPIAIDHAEWLGGTLGEIAAEKAGIIKPHSITVIGPQPPEALQVLLNRCREVGSPAVRFGPDIELLSRAVAVGGQQLDILGRQGEYREVFLPLLGPHQGTNAVLAVAAAEALLVADVPLDQRVVDALGGVVSPGRLDLVGREPTILVDAAHNPAGAGALAAALVDSFNFPDLVVVASIMADKDVPGIIAALAPVASLLVATRNSSSRAAAPDYVATLAAEILGEGRVVLEPDFDDAMETAVAAARERGGAVLATGSVVTAADAALWTERRADRA